MRGTFSLNLIIRGLDNLLSSNATNKAHANYVSVISFVPEDNY